MSVEKESNEKDDLSLLMGNLWYPDGEKINQLRQKYDLPDAPIFTSLPPIAAENKDSLEKKEISIDSYTQSSAPSTSIHNPQTFQADSSKLLPPDDLIIAKADIKPDSDAKNHTPLNDIGQNYTKDNTNLILNWQELVNSALNCEKCKLSYGRTHVVIERGNREAKWMFVGEGPGEQEDMQGKPFVGASGQLLDKMIKAMNLNSQTDVYIANVVKCRPPHNRNPEEEEIAACSNYLKSQISLVKPKIIITLGRYAAQTLLNTDLAVGKLRKKVHSYAGIPLVVTYHPSYLLRTPTAKKDAWADLQLAMQTFCN